MVTNLVEFPLSDGGSVVVAAGGPSSGQDPYGPVLRGRVSEAVVTQASDSFESVVRRVQPAAAAVLDAARSGPQPPSAVTVEFGIEMSADLGAVIASTAVQANFKVTITWQREASR